MATKTVSTSIEFASAPQDVWNLLADFSRYGEWNPVHVSFPGGPPEITSGASFTESIKVMGMPGEMAWSVIECDSPTLLSIAGKGPMGTRVTNTYKLAAAGDGARLEIANEWAGAAIGPMGPALVKEGEKNLAQIVDGLKALVR
jgi:hypothetical protein